MTIAMILFALKKEIPAMKRCYPACWLGCHPPHLNEAGAINDTLAGLGINPAML
jgi:hypothetical protein